MKKILIIDTKAGNLFSLKASIERLGFLPIVLEAPNEEPFDAVVIPGQGRFGTVMKNIRTNKWDRYLLQAKENNIPILGICVGMQIFFQTSEEDIGVKGLAWFKGEARALNFPKKPMVGWATLHSDIWSDESVYFVNSYAIKECNISIATTNYGEEFCASVRQDSFTGVQFHPEKSSQVGSRIIEQALTNFGTDS